MLRTRPVTAAGNGKVKTWDVTGVVLGAHDQIARVSGEDPAFIEPNDGFPDGL